ncbi:hypothetical protein GCM10025863_08030 [Microbacterium suwonense]|uniref:Uncharacterized protein n=1 Tax=Microbacterium suwonense TaxID=683047 RepID=A0ABM8FRB8_9MICO|nr:hypothetical protein GCM10025863_08030 [Microbacterium suwonense]
MGLTVVGEHAGLATTERHGVGLAAAIHLHVQPLGQRIDHRGADAVQTTGCRIGAAAELSTRVQLGEHDLDAGQSGAGLDIDGHAATAVGDLHAAIGVEHDVDLRPVAVDGLIDGVVDDLPEAVHQARRSVGSDVHAGALANGFEAFEHLEMMGGILGGHSHRVYLTDMPGQVATLSRAQTCWGRVRGERNTPQSGHAALMGMVVLSTTSNQSPSPEEAPR